MPLSHADLHQRLELRRNRMLEEIAHLDLRSKPSLGYSSHQADDATFAEEQATNLALRQNAKRLLDQVEDALRRFDGGTYGLCLNCEQEIEPARLKALPYAALCLNCQQNNDKHG
jgi:DnaK suppressor protein